MILSQNEQIIINNITNLKIKELLNIQEYIENIFSFLISETIINDSIKTNESVIIDEEEKPKFNLILKTVPTDKKITILKLVRTLTGLGLKESKSIVDNIPQILKENISKDDAIKIQKDFENTGAEFIIEQIQIKKDL